MSERIAVHTPTKESYDRLMKAYEKKGWHTSGINWCDYGNETAIEFSMHSTYLWTDYYKSRQYTIITVEEALARLWQYERGQEVLVRNNIKNPRHKRIYVTSIEWAEYPHICVDTEREENFKQDKKFYFSGYKIIKPIEEPIKEMTMQEVETALGHKVKIVK